MIFFVITAVSTAVDVVGDEKTIKALYNCPICTQVLASKRPFSDYANIFFSRTCAHLWGAIVKVLHFTRVAINMNLAPLVAVVDIQHVAIVRLYWFTPKSPIMVKVYY